jgi:hypothetical protein
MVIMNIDFESSGGYANIRLKYHGNTDTLPEEVANKLIQLVESSKVFELEKKEVTPTLPGPPDVLHYKLTIHEGNRKVSLSFNDVTVPESLFPLIGFLQELAWEQAGKDNR